MDLHTHCGYLLQQLQEQRIQGLLCDCTLVVKGVCFKAHKNVLAAFSTYFRSLFQTQKSDVFNLVIQDVSGIGQLLDYMYTSHLDVNPENVLALLDMAQCLQMPVVLGLCQSYLKPCPPAAQAPMCPVGGTLSTEHDCSQPHDTYMSEPQRPLSEFGQNKALTQSGESPPLHGYKLRNYYSRQYFKQLHSSTQAPALKPQTTANPERYLTSAANTGQYLNPAPNPDLHLLHVPDSGRFSLPTTNQSPLATSHPTPTTSCTTNYELNLGFNPGLNPNPTVNPGNIPNSTVNQGNSSSVTVNSGLNPDPMVNQGSGTSPMVNPTLNTNAMVTPKLNIPVQPPALDPPLAHAAQPTLSGDPSPSEMSRTMRPKKTVYLKKYNYLRSQKTAESDLCPTLATTQVDLEPTLPFVSQEQTAPPSAMTERQEHPGTEPKSGNSTLNPDVSRSPALTHNTDTPRTQTLTSETLGDQTPNPELLENQACMSYPSGNQTLSPEHLEDQTVTPDPPDEPEPAAATLPPTVPRQYCCSDCGKVFKHPSNLELHKRSHTGEKPFQCNVCGKHFSQAGNLQTHLRRHSGEKPYICELCGKGFTGSGDVQRHKVVHTGEKPHLCDICGKGFNNMSNLKEHKRTHSTELSFTCDQCGKSFNAPRKLLKHKSRHGGEKPHCCSTCGKAFAGSGDLQRHVRSHTGEKPYVCGECNRSFSRSALLRRHRTLYCKGVPLQTSPHHHDNQPESTGDNQPIPPTRSETRSGHKSIRKCLSGAKKRSSAPERTPGARSQPPLPPDLTAVQNHDPQNPNHMPSHCSAQPSLHTLHPTSQDRHAMSPNSSVTEEGGSLGESSSMGDSSSMGEGSGVSFIKLTYVQNEAFLYVRGVSRKV